MRTEPYYSEGVVALIEAVYGAGLLSQGGMECIDDMFKGTDFNGKVVLDIGSGVGGIDIYLAQKYNVDLTGVDVGHFVVEEACKRVKNLKGKVTFVLEAPTDYLKSFENKKFDLIFSKETILHIPVADKSKYFGEVYRVLKDGGDIIIMDWLHKSPQHSAELAKMIDIDQLPYNLITKEEYVAILNNVGFKNVIFEDRSQQATRYSQEDCEKIFKVRGLIVERFGEETFFNALKSWKLQATCFKNGELLAGVFRARK
jgi:phosphoethanolamine N-methyltransferase